MNLAIFDIDGTLTDTDGVDDFCFTRSLAETHGIVDISTDWASYPHTTDSALTFEIFRQRFARVPEEVELEEIRTHFLKLLQGCRAEAPSRFAQIRGARSMLRRLNRESDWRVAIATGGWRVSAAFKLQTAGVDLGEFPAAFADDAFSREEILHTAISKARRRYREDHFARVVSVGDGLWDVRTARKLVLPFVGVGKGETAERLRNAGTSHVVADFKDYDNLKSCLAEAQVPAAGPRLP